jgi:hypothetical protein
MVRIRNPSAARTREGKPICALVASPTMPLPPVITFLTNLTMFCMIVRLPAVPAERIEFHPAAHCQPSPEQSPSQCVLLSNSNSRPSPFCSPVCHLLVIPLFEDIATRLLSSHRGSRLHAEESTAYVVHQCITFESASRPTFLQPSPKTRRSSEPCFAEENCQRV